MRPQLTPNCKKFFAELKKVDEDWFEDYFEEDIKKASCDDLANSSRYSEYSSWDSYLDSAKENFEYDHFADMVETNPQLKAFYEAPAGSVGSEDEYAVGDFLADEDFWFEGFLNDLFERLKNNRNLEKSFNDSKSDALYDCRDAEEESRDPYGYRGLSKSMFYASRKVTASDRSALIRLASTMPAGSSERRAILAGLEGGRDFSSELAKLKKLMPAGTQLRYAGSPEVSLEWNKKGGHAGKDQILKTREKFEAIGFRSTANSYGSASSYEDPTYSFSETLEKDGLLAYFFTSYGVTAQKNSFSISVRVDPAAR